MARTTIKDLERRIHIIEKALLHLIHKEGIQDLSGELHEVIDDDEEIPPEMRNKVGFRYGQKQKRRKGKRKN